MQGIVGIMVGDADGAAHEDVTNIYKVGQNTTRLLLAAGDLVVGWLLLRQAAVALDALDAGAVRQGQGLLRGQGGGRAVLRPPGPAPAPGRARDRRGHRLSLMDVPEAAF